MAAAIDLESNGWTNEAIAAYERVLNFAPKQKGVAHKLARLYSQVGHSEKASHFFAVALTETHNNPEVVGDYGYFLFEQGDYSAAEQQLRRALQDLPSDQRIRSNLAIVLASTQRIDESLRLFEESVGKAAARFNLATILARSGDLATSRHLVEEALVLNPQMPEARALKAWLEDSI